MNCKICDKELTGAQTMFCCRKCANKDGNRVHQNYASQKMRGWERKLYLIDLLGGSCQKCGYDKNIAALEFHHRDPKQKETELDLRKLSNATMDWILNEAAKCDLLCSNCHREHHSPDCAIELVRAITKPPVLKKPKVVHNCTCGAVVEKKGNVCVPCYRVIQRKVKERPTREQLESDLLEMSYLAVGRKYGVSDNTIRKWLK